VTFNPAITAASASPAPIVPNPQMAIFSLVEGMYLPRLLELDVCGGTGVYGYVHRLMIV
jgi:hypothetical protein